MQHIEWKKIRTATTIFLKLSHVTNRHLINTHQYSLYLLLTCKPSIAVLHKLQPLRCRPPDSTAMKPDISLILPSLATLVAANHEANQYAARTVGLITPSVTKTIYRTTIQRRLHEPDLGAAPRIQEPSGLTTHSAQHRTGRSDGGGDYHAYEFRARGDEELSRANVERDVKLYDMRVLLQGDKGYISIYVPSSVSKTFCKDGAGTSRKDLTIKLADESPLTILIPAKEAVDFCRGFNKQHKSSGSSAPADKITGAKDDAAQDHAASPAADTLTSKKKASGKPTPRATPAEDSGDASEVSPEEAGETEVASPVKTPVRISQTTPEKTSAVQASPTPATADPMAAILESSKKTPAANPIAAIPKTVNGM